MYTYSKRGSFPFSIIDWTNRTKNIKIDKGHEELKQCKSTWPNSMKFTFTENLHKVRAEQINILFWKSTHKNR